MPAPVARDRGRRAGRTVVALLLAATTGLAWPGPAAAAAQPVGDVRATVETAPMANTGDSADDPALWVHPSDPARSTVIGNDKGGALEVYDMAGARVQRITGGFFGNVDVLQGVRTGRGRADLVVTYRAGLRVFAMNPGTLRLSNITDAASGSIPTPHGGEGLCLYRSPRDGAVYAFSNTRDGRVAQFALTDSDGDGLVEGAQVRTWDVGSEIEACVADNDTGDVYIAEENVGIWKYGAEPGDPTSPGSRTLVDGLVGAGGHLLADVEGLTMVYQADGTGYLLASAQAPFGVDNFYGVYERQGSNHFLRTFRVVDGAAADGCSHTDGIAALATDLGPRFPHGVFVCQDDRNTAPGGAGNQNFKLVPLERVVTLDSAPASPPPTTAALSFVGAAASNANTTSHRVAVPGGVRAGDGLVLFFSSNTTAGITAPAGWQSLGSVEASGTITRAWRRVAGAGEAGSSVSVVMRRASKANLTLAAYRGTSTANPVARVERAGETVERRGHTTPTVPLPSTGAWALSYWSHKDSSSSTLAAPRGVTVRAAGTHTGSGRVTALLADSGRAVTAGTYGGLTATAGTASRHASMWTVVLAPRAGATRNQPPNPSAGVECTVMTCTATAAGSADPDGSIRSYRWDFGDGASASGRTVTHRYGAPGTRTVTLTVTDNQGATARATRKATVSGISFVGQAASNTNATSHRVTVPRTVVAGDALLLFFSSNTTAKVTAPSGWRELGTARAHGAVTTVWRRVASAADPGRSLTVDVDRISKANLALAAYRGTSTDDPVARHAVATESVARSIHVTPEVSVGTVAPVLSYWTHKDAATSRLDPPDGVRVRGSGSQSGSGRVTALLADSGAAVAVGKYGHASATAAGDSRAASMWTVVLAPA
jgi:myo-inositol-hexaphosphate 3-phosphohydrolase/PKD repeat protein